MNIPLKLAGLLLASLVFSFGYAQKSEADFAWTKMVGSHAHSFSAKIFKVNDFGAVADGKMLTTSAIQKTIDACAAAGGGSVVFGKGIYLTGSIFLKSNVHLIIGEGVTILGSQRFEDYPEINTRIAGIEMKWPAAVINVIDQKNVEISGEGQINANGKFCWDKYWKMRKEYESKGLRWVVDYDAKRVRTILVQNCTDVTLKDLHISNSGFWTVQILYSSYITANGLVIRNNMDGKGPSTDGVDIDSSTWVLVENCDVDCNDDDYCLKAGRDWDGLRVNRPTEYVLLRNCIARRGGGCLTIGSETSGSIRHVVATNMRGIGTGNALQIKSAYTRGGVVEDIHFMNSEVDSAKKAFTFVTNWNPSYSYSTLPKGYDAAAVPEYWLKLLRKPSPESKGIPQFRNIYVNNVHVTNAGIAFVAEGMPDGKSYLTGFHFDHVSVRAEKAGSIDFAKDWSMNRVSVNAVDGSSVEIKNAEHVSFN